MTDIADKFKKSFAKYEETEKKKKELTARKIDHEYEQMQEADNNLELAKASHFGPLRPDQVQKLAQESTEYLKAVSRSMKFISDAFNGMVAFFAKSLILICGDSGKGKSTAVANIVLSTISQRDPVTGKDRRALVLTNEESAMDFYNRVTSLIKGWSYSKHDQFSQEQIMAFEEWIPRLAEGGRLTVIDDSYEVTPGVFVNGMTSTVEGIETIFENLIRDGEFYDVVILDYYQGIVKSNKNPRAEYFEVQEQLTYVLEKFRKLYPAPIVVLSQIMPEKVRDEEKPTPIQYRWRGSKSIITKSTMIIEMIADMDNFKTEWFIHKSRFSESTGRSVITGFKGGKFVKYDNEFKAGIATIKEKRKTAELDKEIGLKDVKPGSGEEDEKS
jgi:hypothetical protein